MTCSLIGDDYALSPVIAKCLTLLLSSAVLFFDRHFKDYKIFEVTTGGIRAYTDLLFRITKSAIPRLAQVTLILGSGVLLSYLIGDRPGDELGAYVIANEYLSLILTPILGWLTSTAILLAENPQDTHMTISNVSLVSSILLTSISVAVCMSMVESLVQLIQGKQDISDEFLKIAQVIFSFTLPLAIPESIMQFGISAHLSRNKNVFPMAASFLSLYGVGILGAFLTNTFNHENLELLLLFPLLAYGLASLVLVGRWYTHELKCRTYQSVCCFRDCRTSIAEGSENDSETRDSSRREDQPLLSQSEP